MVACCYYSSALSLITSEFLNVSQLFCFCQVRVSVVDYYYISAVSEPWPCWRKVCACSFFFLFFMPKHLRHYFSYFLLWLVVAASFVSLLRVLLLLPACWSTLVVPRFLQYLCPSSALDRCKVSAFRRLTFNWSASFYKDFKRFSISKPWWTSFSLLILEENHS